MGGLENGKEEGGNNFFFLLRIGLSERQFWLLNVPANLKAWDQDLKEVEEPFFQPSSSLLKVPRKIPASGNMGQIPICSHLHLCHSVSHLQWSYTWWCPRRELYQWTWAKQSLSLQNVIHIIRIHIRELFKSTCVKTLLVHHKIHIFIYYP